jgi:magnesium-protoporphyrin O-methyltransferase
MHATGRLFPRANRAPAIEPVDVRGLEADMTAAPSLAAWSLGRSERISAGFYTSHAMEIVRR